MDILFVAPRAWPSVGGSQSFLRNLTLELAHRHRVKVLALGIGDEPAGRLWDNLRPPPTFEPFADGAVEIEPLRLDRRRRALLAPLVAQVMPVTRRYAYGRARVGAAQLYAHVVAPLIERHARDADVVQVWGTGFLAAAATEAAARAGRPTAIMASLHPGQWGDDPASASVYRRADLAIAQLESEASAYRSLGVRPDRIVVCGACTPALPNSSGSELRRRQGIRGPLVLFLGVRRPYKGAHLLLEAAPLVSARTNATFAFVGRGDGPLPASVGAHILDIGEVSDEERGAWLNAADVLCLPSSAESFGLTVLEAWSVGTPVVVSDIPALKELVAKGRGGVVVRRDAQELAHAITHLLESPQRLRELGAAGHAYWRSAGSPAAVAARFEAAYLGLTETREASAA